MQNTFVDIFLEAANNETPISSGNGEAIINPVRTGIKYFNIFILLRRITIFSFDNFLSSFANECLINLKKNKSANNAPKPAIIPAKIIFCSFANINNNAVAGAAVKP